MANRSIIYLVEQRFYSANDLTQRTNVVLSTWLSKLPAGIIYSDSRGYQFRYVGLIGIGKELVVVLPKYMADRSEEELVCKDEVRQLMQVLRVYNDKYTGRLASVDEIDNIESVFTGEPAIAMALIEDYLEYGYWSNTEQIVSQNADALVDWQRTVDRTMPLISDGAVLYPVVYSTQRQTLADSLILRLHKWGVRYCLKTYQDFLPGFGGVDYDPEAAEVIEELGNRSYLITLLEQELRVTYRDTQVRVLRALIQLISLQSETENETKLTFFGTTSFHVIWEQACKVAFGDMSYKIKNLPIPSWIRTDNELFANAENKIVPDAVWYDSKNLLVVDAKYYNVRFVSNQVKANPGMPDVMKQLVYEDVLVGVLGLEQALKLNVFVLPRNNNHGAVLSQDDWLWGWIDSKIPLFTQKFIAVLLIPPCDIFECYLSQKRLVKQIDFIERTIAKNPINFNASSVK